MRSYKFIKQIIEALKLIRPKSKDTDFSVFMFGIPPTRKQLLIEECRKQDVSIYIDEPTEQSIGIYAELRGVVSEAELERRLNTKKTTTLSMRANVVALFALVVSVLDYAQSFL